MSYCYLDFEYNGTSEPLLNLVSCSVLYNGVQTNHWLHNSPSEKKKLGNWLFEHRDEVTLVAYNATAEARAMLSLGLNPLDFKWFDLYLEYRCLNNHNHKLQYGRQLIDGKIKTTKPPKNKWKQTEEEKKSSDYSKTQHNYGAACFKLLGKLIDTDRKKEVRDIIISANEFVIEEEKKEILEYNDDDVVNLPDLLKATIQQYYSLLPKTELTNLKAEMFLRADYAVRTAIMEKEGYPIDLEATKIFTSRIEDILKDCQEDINSQFPDIKPFRWNKKEERYSWNQKGTKDWVRTLNKANWVQTDSKDVSLSLDAFKRYFDFRHDYPQGNLGAQFVRYLTLRQNLNGFLQSKTAKKKSTFWDYVGSDGRVRSYFGIYGAQSARSQPKATGFLFLKSAWMRVLCVPPRGKVITGIDYKSQEFLISALLAKDSNMYKAYMSGDPYLYLAKLAGAVPMDGKREDYEEIRDLFKSTTLGLSYGMSKIGLANKLTEDLGRNVSQVEAQKLIDTFNKIYRKHYIYKKQVIREYRKKGYLKLPCGWYMFGSNDNDRSAGNFPVQGFASSLMRDAVRLAQDKGLKVIKTLHDAIYIEHDVGDTNSIELLGSCMDTAFRKYFDKDLRAKASVGLDGNTWGLDYPEEETSLLVGKIKLKQQRLYVDGRSKKEYNTFKKYLKIA